jgi:hypothetical protein
MGVRQLSSASLQSIARTCSVPFTVASSLFLSMYLHETARKSSLQVADGATYLKIPAIVLAVLVFAIEIILDAIYLSNPTVPGIVRSWNALLYAFICMILGGYYFFVAFKIIQALNQLSDSPSTRQRRFRWVRITGQIPVQCVKPLTLFFSI